MFRKEIVTILVVAVLFGVSPVRATTWTSGHHEIFEGDLYGEIWMENDATADMWGGDVGRTLLFDQSSINIYGGGINNVTTTNNSSMSIYAGELGSLLIMDNSSANLYGGNIERIRNSQSVPLGTEIDLEIFCKSWAWNEPTNHITGIWGDDSSFDIILTDTHWDSSDPYRMIDHISFNIIPEPTTGILLLTMGVFFLRRRR